MFIDSHCHLDSNSYQQDLNQVLANMQQAQVTSAIIPALNLKSAQKIQQIHQQHPNLYPTAGIHPHEADSYQAEQLQLEIDQLVEQKAIVALGETGLEGHYDLIPDKTQERSLEHHLALASTHQLPLILHCREREERLFEILSHWDDQLTCKGVVHCFTGPWEWAKKFLDLGWHIGITGVVTFKKSHHPQEVASQIPLERLLIETDGPYLAPHPYRGKRNEPAYVVQVAQKIAELRSLPIEQIAQKTTQNTQQLFRLHSPHS